MNTYPNIYLYILVNKQVGSSVARRLVLTGLSHFLSQNYLVVMSGAEQAVE